MRISYKIHQKLPLFAPYWAQIGASPLIFAFLKDTSYQIWLKSVQRKSLRTDDGRDMITGSLEDRRRTGHDHWLT